MITKSKGSTAYSENGIVEHYDWRGLSTDEKPTDATVNDLFLEVDTGDKYYFSNGVWSKQGALG